MNKFLHHLQMIHLLLLCHHLHNQLLLLHHHQMQIYRVYPGYGLTPSDANSDVVGVSDGVKDSCDVFGHIENELNIVNHPLPKYVRDYSNFNDASNITPLNYTNN
eukprot:523685_1